MKYLSLLSFLALAACNSGTSGTTTTPVNNSAGAGFKRWIPEWKGGDTLYAQYKTSLTYDTIFTDKVGDTSFIRYRGVRYYLFQYNTKINETEDTTLRPQGYTFTAFNTRPDTVGQYKLAFGVHSSLYKNYLGTERQTQKLLGFQEPFNPPVLNDGYYTSRRER
jgi:hypothetical protein